MPFLSRFEMNFGFGTWKDLFEPKHEHSYDSMKLKNERHCKLKAITVAQI